MIGKSLLLIRKLSLPFFHSLLLIEKKKNKSFILKVLNSLYFYVFQMPFSISGYDSLSSSLWPKI
jgi:hypothetical protein